MSPIILREAQPAVTLDDALLSMTTFPNGCNFRLRIEGRRKFLEYGCYGVHPYLTQGAARLLMLWLNQGNDGRRELTDIVAPETIMELMARPPCRVCGGLLFKVPNE